MAPTLLPKRPEESIPLIQLWLREYLDVSKILPACNHHFLIQNRQ